MFDCQKGMNNLVLPMEMSCCFYNSLIDNNFTPPYTRVYKTSEYQNPINSENENTSVETSYYDTSTSCDDVMMSYSFMSESCITSLLPIYLSSDIVRRLLSFVLSLLTLKKKIITI